jgi:hypothetical protein
VLVHADHAALEHAEHVLDGVGVDGPAHVLADGMLTVRCSAKS